MDTSHPSDRRRFGLDPAWQPSDSARLPKRVWERYRPIGANPEALHGYLSLSHVPWPLSIDPNRKRADALPRFRAATELASNDGLIRDLLRASVERSLPFDGSEPVGVFLSGGLDSSLIAALARDCGARLICFTLDFGAPWDVEVEWARSVAAHLGAPIQVVDARPDVIARSMPAAARALDEPFGDAVVPGLWLLGKAAADSVGIVLNGEGGDQLFGGWANKPMIAATVYGSSTVAEEYLRTYHRFLGIHARLYSADFAGLVSTVSPLAWIEHGLPSEPGCPPIHRLRAANIALKGFQNIAPRCALLAKCHGVSIRAPFFDSALAEATFSLPETDFLSGAIEKPVLKRIARNLLPDAVVDREKRGMGAPALEWVRGTSEVGRMVARYLGDRRLRREGRFRVDFVRSMLSGVDPTSESFRPRRLGEKLWALFFWELWRDVHQVH